MITPEQVMEELQYYIGEFGMDYFIEIKDGKHFPVTTTYLSQQEKKDELLGLYQKKEQCIVCVPVMKDSSILHCVVRYSEDEKYMRVLSQIKQLEEKLK